MFLVLKKILHVLKKIGVVFYVALEIIKQSFFHTFPQLQSPFLALFCYWFLVIVSWGRKQVHNFSNRNLQNICIFIKPYLLWYT